MHELQMNALIAWVLPVSATGALNTLLFNYFFLNKQHIK